MHDHTDVSSCSFQPSSSQHLLAYGVYWRSRAGELLLLRGGDVSQLMYGHTEYGVPILVSGSPSFGGASKEEQTNSFDDYEKAPVVGTQDREDLIGWYEKQTKVGTAPCAADVPIDATSESAQSRVNPKRIWAAVGSSRGSTIRRIVSRTWEPGGWWPQQEVETINTESKDELLQEQPMSSRKERQWKSGARQFLAMTVLQLGTHLAYDGGWGRIQKPWDVIELFSTDAPVSPAVLSAEGRATQPYDGGLGNLLKTKAAREQVLEDVERWKPRLIVAYLPDWMPEVSELALELVRKQLAEG